MTFLQAACVPISLASKAPQILSNHKLKSTGTLSAFAVFNALLGCLARVFTTATEVKDKVILWGFILAAVLNAVIVGQMIVYWNNTPTLSSTAKDRFKPKLALNDASTSASSGGSYGIYPGSPISPSVGGKGGEEHVKLRRSVSESEEKDVGVPPSPAGSFPAKKWSRKVD